MKTLLLFSFCFFYSTITGFAQVKIGDNPTAITGSSLLEMETTNKGMLLPRVSLTSTASPAPLAAHIDGMTLFNTATAGDVTPGYYYNYGGKWIRIGETFKTWDRAGNAGTVDGSDFIGSTDNAPLNFRAFNQKAGRITSGGITFFGYKAGNVNTGASNNTGIGYQALLTNTTGTNNTALGSGADVATTGLTNATAIGYAAVAGASNALVLGGTGTNQVNVGVGTTTPKSYLETAGSFGTAITLTAAASITLDSTHHTIILTGGSPTITLPPAGASNRRTYRIINQNAVVVTISPYVDYISGLVLTTIPVKTKIEIQSDGTTWYRVD